MQSGNHVDNYRRLLFILSLRSMTEIMILDYGCLRITVEMGPFTVFATVGTWTSDSSSWYCTETCRYCRNTVRDLFRYRTDFNASELQHAHWTRHFKMDDEQLNSVAQGFQQVQPTGSRVFLSSFTGQGIITKLERA